MAGEPYWFEIGVTDATKARAFYGGLLGWEFETGPSGDDSAGAVIRTPGIDGGLHAGDDDRAAGTQRVGGGARRRRYDDSVGAVGPDILAVDHGEIRMRFDRLTQHFCHLHGMTQ